MQRLSESELDVMLALWEAEDIHVSRADLEQRLSHRSWSPTTINTFLSRLQDKEYVACERRGKSNYYTPIVSRENYQSHEGKNILQKLYQNSLKRFVLSVSSVESLSDADISELQDYLENLKGGDGDAE